jgi:hypothetical protein
MLIRETDFPHQDSSSDMIKNEKDLISDKNTVDVRTKTRD